MGWSGAMALDAKAEAEARVEAEETTRSVQDGVYSKAQASRGRREYQQICQTCHERGAFSGSYMESWTGRTAYDLFDLLRSTMPEEDPGVGGSEVFTDIVAFMFSLSELPAGEVEMPSDVESLKLILIEGPYGASEEQ
jgi:mono/diheme cytochrome c family protein